MKTKVEHWNSRPQKVKRKYKERRTSNSVPEYKKKQLRDEWLTCSWSTVWSDSRWPCWAKTIGMRTARQHRLLVQVRNIVANSSGRFLFGFRFFCCCSYWRASPLLFKWKTRIKYINTLFQFTYELNMCYTMSFEMSRLGKTISTRPGSI